MDLKCALRFPIFVFLFVFTISSSCSTPSWFPIKSGPPHKAKTKELIDKEVVLIDRQEYVKVLNPKASEGRDLPKYLYVPVNEYLAKKDAYTFPTARREEPSTRSLLPPEIPPAVSGRTPEVPVVTAARPSVSNLKKKVLISYFDDRTTTPEEMFGDWVSEKLINEVSLKTPRVLFVDYQMAKDFFEGKGLDPKTLVSPGGLRLLNEVFGITAVVVGDLAGPYVFTTRAPNSQENTASAIIRINVKVMDTYSGVPLKEFSAMNPVLAARQKGPFPEEKAKIKAIDLTLSELGSALSRELDALDWSCRIVKVDGDQIYLNAGRSTGLKVGDVLEVFRPGENGNRGERKGRIEVAGFLGIDASMSRAIDVKKPDARDIVRIASRE